MHSQVLSYWCRTHTSLWAGAIAVPVFAGALLSEGSPWVGDPQWALSRIGGSMLIVLVFVAMASALDSAHPATGERALVELGPARPFGWRILGRLGGAVPAGAVHAAAAIAAVAVSAASARELHIPIGLLAVQTLALVFAAALGSACGLIGNAYLAAAIAGAGQALLVYQMADDVLLVSGGDSPYAGLTVKPSMLATAIVTLVVASALLLTTRYRIRRGWPTRATLAGGIAAIAGCFGVSGAVNAYPIMTTGEEPSACTGAAPRVCMFPTYRRMLPPVRRAADDLASAAANAGLDPHLLPDTLEQVTPGAKPQPVGTANLALQPHELGQDTVYALTVANALTTPNWCPQLKSQTAPPRAYFRRQGQAAAWVMFQSGNATVKQFRGAAGSLAKLSREQQLAAVRETLEGFRRCDLDL